MTPTEKEFIAKLTCVCLSREELWNVSFNAGIIGYARPGQQGFGVRYMFLQDVYLTDLNLIMPAGATFTYYELNDAVRSD